MELRQTEQLRQVSPKLAPWLSDLHAQIAELQSRGFKPTAISARESLANLVRAYVKDSPVLPWVNDEIIPGAQYNVPVRIYHPAPESARPVIVFCHGGGHGAGSVSAYDPVCRKLALATGHIVVSVEYRLAPENPYPAGLTDAYTAVRGAFDALDRRHLLYEKKLSIAGDSAGGALAASISCRSQSDHSLILENQILIYPSLDYTMCQKSIEENGENYFLTKGRVAWYFDNYFQHAEDRYQVSPLYNRISSRLPRTLIISAGFDPLRDEAGQYVERLKEAGVEYEHLYFDDMVHAFLFLEEMVKEECDKVYRAIGSFLNSRASAG